MDTIFDILVNISPIMLILGIYAIFKFREGKQKIWLILLCVSIILFSMAVVVAGDEYGNSYIAITLLIIALVF